MGQHKEIFEDLARWQSWLEVEAALAEVQADLQVIPPWAAAQIASKANINNFDEEKISDEIAKTGSPVFALVSIFADRGSSVFSVEEILPEDTKRYGIVSGKSVEERLMLVENLVEKPDSSIAPSLLGIQGRYVFTSEIFDHLKILKTFLLQIKPLMTKNLYLSFDLQ